MYLVNIIVPVCGMCGWSVPTHTHFLCLVLPCWMVETETAPCRDESLPCPSCPMPSPYLKCLWLCGELWMLRQIVLLFLCSLAVCSRLLSVSALAILWFLGCRGSWRRKVGWMAYPWQKLEFLFFPPLLLPLLPVCHWLLLPRVFWWLWRVLLDPSMSWVPWQKSLGGSLPG